MVMMVVRQRASGGGGALRRRRIRRSIYGGFRRGGSGMDMRRLRMVGVGAVATESNDAAGSGDGKKKGESSSSSSSSDDDVRGGGGGGGVAGGDMYLNQDISTEFPFNPEDMKEEMEEFERLMTPGGAAQMERTLRAIMALGTERDSNATVDAEDFRRRFAAQMKKQGGDDTDKDEDDNSDETKGFTDAGEDDYSVEMLTPLERLMYEFWDGAPDNSNSEGTPGVDFDTLEKLSAMSPGELEELKREYIRQQGGKTINISREQYASALRALEEEEELIEPDDLDGTGASVFPNDISTTMYDGSLGWNVLNSKSPVTIKRTYMHEDTVTKLADEMEAILEKAEAQVVEHFGQETLDAIMKPGKEGDSSADSKLALEKEMTAAMGAKGFSTEEGKFASAPDGMPEAGGEATQILEMIREKERVSRDLDEQEAMSAATADIATEDLDDIAVNDQENGDGASSSSAAGTPRTAEAEPDQYKPPLPPEEVPLGAASSWERFEDDVRARRNGDETYIPPVDAVPKDFGDPYEEEDGAAEEERTEAANAGDGSDNIVLTWEPKPLRDLVTSLEAHLTQAVPEDIDLDTMVRNICHDATKVRPGDVFVCLRAGSHGGERGDGHDYASAAATAGAVAIVGQYRCRGLPDDVPQLYVSNTSAALKTLACSFYENPSQKMSVTAVVGSSGKTSVASLVNQFMYKTMDLQVPDDDDDPVLRGGCGIISSTEMSYFTSYTTKTFLTDNGDVWRSRHKDSTKGKRCTATRSKPMWFPVWVRDTGEYTDDPNTHIFTKPPISRYLGKYPFPSTSTPDVPTLQMMMAAMVRNGVENLVLEVANDALPAAASSSSSATEPMREERSEQNGEEEKEQASAVGSSDAGDTIVAKSHRVVDGDCVDIDVAIFTNLSRDGLDAFDGTWEDYRRRVGNVFGQLHDEERQVAIINFDDPEAAYFIRRASPVPVVTYALRNPKADVYLIGEAEITTDGTLVSIRTPIGDLQVKTRLIGRPMLSNLLAAVCYALVKKVDLLEINQVVQGLKCPPGRMENIQLGHPLFFVVDRARTPAALGRLLDAAADFSPKPKRVITVIGCPGDTLQTLGENERLRGARGIGGGSISSSRSGGGNKGSISKSDRALMGRIAHEKSDIVFFTNDNPGRERPEDIIGDMVAGLPPEVADIFPFLDFDWLQDPLRLDDAKYGTPGCPQYEATLYFQSEVKRFVIEDRFDAIRLAVGMCNDGDTLVVAGKGEEDFQVLGDTKGWFDDRVEIKDAVQRFVSLKQKFYDVDCDTSSKDFGKTYNMLDTSRLPWRRVTRPGSPLHDPDMPKNPYDNSYIKQYLERRGIPMWQWEEYWPY